MRFKLLSAGLLCGLATYVNAQVTELSDLQFFAGAGSDTAGLVIDFLDGSGSVAWGVLFDGSIDGEGLLEAVANDYPGFSVSITAGFLNDVVYGTQQGLGGQPDYWGTWSGNPTSWTSNLGIGADVPAGTWFGCSYMDFDPAIEPSAPVTAATPVASLIERSDLQLSVYPVPVIENLNVKGDERISLEVYNGAGQVIINREEAIDHRVPTSSWPSGAYLIVAQSESGNRTVRRVIK